MKEKSEDRILYENKQKSNLLAYYTDLGNSFSAKINQLSYIIGNTHYLSVGNYKENLLKNEIKKFLPSNYSIGTGFVIFPKFGNKNNKSIHDHCTSNQMDIIIYNNNICAPIFQDGDFIVIAPEAVVALMEVKGYNSNNSKPLSGFVDFTKNGLITILYLIMI